MAESWFAKINSMTQEVRENLIQKISGNTMVGEYIGSQDYQHLVKYSRVTIIFYAIVGNDSEESCWTCS